MGDDSSSRNAAAMGTVVACCSWRRVIATEIEWQRSLAGTRGAAGDLEGFAFREVTLLKVDGVVRYLDVTHTKRIVSMQYVFFWL